MLFRLNASTRETLRMEHGQRTKPKAQARRLADTMFVCTTFIVLVPIVAYLLSAARPLSSLAALVLELLGSATKLPPQHRSGRRSRPSGHGE